MTITVTKQDGVATVKLDRADKLNALTGEMYEGLADAFAQLTFDDEVRAVVLAGEGHRGFCSGGDVRDITWLTPKGAVMTDADWHSETARCLGIRLSGDQIDEVDELGQPITDDTMLLLLN